MIFVLLAIAAPVWHLHIIDRHMPFQKNDLVSRWIGTRDALHGMDPYSAAVTQEIQTAYYGRPLTSADTVDGQQFFYPAYLVPLLAPLTWMSWPTAQLVFLIGLLPLLAGSFWLCLRSLDLPLGRHRTTLILLLAMASWPVMWGLRLQQLTLVVTILIFTSCFLLKRGHVVPAGILLAISTFKPQLVLPLLAWLLVWALLQRMWSFIVSFASTLAVLALWTEKIVPHWFAHWKQGLNGYGAQHVLPLQNSVGHWPGLALTVLLVAYSATLLWKLRRCSASSREFACAVALALATAVSATPGKLPFIYNQVVLLPACVILIYTKPTGQYVELTRLFAIATLIWGFTAIYVSVLGETAFGPSPIWDTIPFQNILLPVVVTIALAANASKLIFAASEPTIASSV